MCRKYVPELRRHLSAVTAATVLVVALAGACGTGDDGPGIDARAGDVPLGGSLNRGEVRLLPPAPFDDRHDVEVVPIEGGVAALGGFTLEHGDTVLYHTDGATLTGTDRRWSEIPPAPGEALYSPGVVSTGSELIILGTPCGRAPIPADEDAVNCDESTLVAFSFSLEARQWTQLASIDEGALGLQYPRGAWTTAKGWDGTSAIFLVSAPTASRVVSVSTRGHAARVAAMPRAHEAEQTFTCFTDDALYAVRLTHVIDVESRPDPSSPDHRLPPGIRVLNAPIQTFEFDTAGRWTALPEHEKKLGEDEAVEWVACSDNEIVYFPGSEERAAGNAVLWFEPATAAWEPMPGPPLTFDTLTEPAEVDGVKVLWSGSGEKIVRLAPGAASWETSPNPLNSAVLVTTLPDRIVVHPDGDNQPLTQLGVYRP
jgi:hypothetical protein